MKTSKLQLAQALGQPSSDKRLDILRRIGEAGSISEAARGAGVSYKAAWQAIDTLSNLAGLALVERLVGGAGGGGARLTLAGANLLAAAQKMSLARNAVLDEIATGAGALATMPNLAALALRTSMRNQLPCTVRALRAHTGAVRVELTLSDGTRLTSRITRESAELLNLLPGQSALALCKATAVVVASTFAAEDDLNLLGGHVSRASRSRKGGEIVVALPSGLQIVGFCKPGDVFTAGATAIAAVNESAVVLAVAG